MSDKKKRKKTNREDAQPDVQVDERRVAAYERLMVAEERLYQLWEQRGEGMNWVGEALGSPLELDPALWVLELGEKVAALGGQLEIAAVFPNETVTLLIEPGPTHATDEPTSSQ
jgi:hypothetical protein